MAKNLHHIIYILIFYYLGTGCVHQDQISDTPPAEAVNIVPERDPLPIAEAVPIQDTLSITTVNLKPTKPAKPDTVIKTVVVYERPAAIDYPTAVQKVYNSQIGVREKTGNNDGPIVEMYLRSTGLGKGNPWCAAFVHWCLERGGIKNPINAYSPTTVNKNNLVWFQMRQVKPVRTADVISLYFPNLGRVGHTGFIDRDIGNGMYESVEGNTNSQNSREGNGVYRRRRSFNATYAISRWIK